MALTKVSTDGVKDDAITSGKIPANAVGASELADNAVDTNAIADQAVALSKLPHGDGSSDGKFLRANNGADPTFETVNTDLVSDTSPQLGGNLDSNGHHIVITDGEELRLGDDHDTKIRFNGSKSQIVSSVQFDIDADIIDIHNAAQNATKARFLNNQVELYHNNSKKFETTSDGGTITGELDVHKSGTGDVFHVQGNGTGAVVAKVENAYNSDNDRFAILELKSGKGSIRFNSNGDSNEGAITYNMADNTMVFGVNNASEKLRIQSGGGISFNGDTAAANALDDYEEGTWTVNTDVGAPNSVHSASYTKIGRSVTVSAYITCPTSSSGSNFRILSLPFTTLGNSNYAIGAAYTQVHTTDNVFVQINPGNNDLYVYKRVGNSVTFADLSGAYLLFTCTYFTG